MLKSQLLHEKNRLAKLLEEVQERKNHIVSNSTQPENLESQVWNINQRILELQEEIKAIDRKLH